MADPVDRANDQADEMLEAQIAQARRPTRGPVATGRCLFCDSLVAPGLRWCDSACAQDYQYEQEALARNGG